MIPRQLLFIYLAERLTKNKIKLTCRTIKTTTHMTSKIAKKKIFFLNTKNLKKKKKQYCSR